MYTGNAFVSQLFDLPLLYRIILSIIIWIFSIFMIYLYAPADTENVPVVSMKERKKRRIFAYIIVTVMMIVGCIIQNNIISNILLIGTLLQTISITRIAYKITNNKYGYEEYLKSKNAVVN